MKRQMTSGDTPKTRSKIGDGARRVCIPVDTLTALSTDILCDVGCPFDTAQMVSEHLVEANLSGVESHGVMRLMQYCEQFRSDYMSPHGRPRLKQNSQRAWIVDGNTGIGIPALSLAVDHGCDLAKKQGISATAIVNCGHTGRLGAFVEAGANRGCLTICIGGGGRERWRMVAPYGGASARLPTNPYAFGIPGGKQGPVVLDFATSKIAGGWIYAAKSAGFELPEGCVIDAAGNPTRDPEDYFNGGAILPAGAAKGYGLAVIAELIGEAMLGPVTTEINWFLICVDIERYQTTDQFQCISEQILVELRECPPAPGFNRVEIPGERERNQSRISLSEGILLPMTTWQQLTRLATELKGP